MTEQKTQKHLLYYIIFILFECLGIASLFFVASDRFMQFLVVCFMSSFYVGWSIMHHFHHHNVTTKIVIEYMLIGLLGVVISFLIFQQL